MEHDRPTSNEANHPYGDVGHYAGLEAYSLLDFLSRHIAAEECNEKGWHDNDGDAISALGAFDWLLTHIRATEEVSTEEMADFDIKVIAFRAALPFTEAERNWLVKPSYGSLDPLYENLVKAVHSWSGEVISAGIRTAIDGHDLLRRWVAWRREIEEYADQGTLDVARETLRGIVAILAPRKALPTSYQQLRSDVREP